MSRPSPNAPASDTASGARSPGSNSRGPTRAAGHCHFICAAAARTPAPATAAGGVRAAHGVVWCRSRRRPRGDIGRRRRRGCREKGSSRGCCRAARLCARQREGSFFCGNTLNGTSEFPPPTVAPSTSALRRSSATLRRQRQREGRGQPRPPARSRSAPRAFSGNCGASRNARPVRVACPATCRAASPCRSSWHCSQAAARTSHAATPVRRRRRRATPGPPRRHRRGMPMRAALPRSSRR